MNGGYEYNDLNGTKQLALSAQEKIEKGKISIAALREYKSAKEKNDEILMAEQLSTFKENFQYFGYGFLNDPKSIIPNVPLTFYSFRIMVGLGFYFIIFFVALLLIMFRNDEPKKWLLRLAIFTIPLAYLASMSGWIVAEVGRQPWTIQDLLPTVAAVSQIDASAVQITFWLFMAIFTALLIAEIKIMTKQINIGPKEGGH